MKVIFMGTPDFSVFSLERLGKCEEIDVMAVVTQPDKPRGRGHKLQPTPVKKKALELGFNVLQSKNVNKKSFLKQLSELSPDVIVVVAFGQKLGKELLELPKYGCINLHASLLPEYRGASPIHQAILDGRKYTGVTTMYMAEGWDTGDMIYKERVEIEDDDSVGILHDKLAATGADLLLKTLFDIDKGTAPREGQDHKMASYASKIDKKTGRINWNNLSLQIYNQVRGVNPWPGAYTFYKGDLLKVWGLSIISINDNKNSFLAGTVIKADTENGFLVKTADGVVEILELQMAGRKRMPAKDFLHGYTIDEGDILDIEE